MSPLKPCPAKTLLRTEIAARIAALTPEEKARQSNIVYEKVISHPFYKSSSRVALFMSTPDEVDTAPLIRHVQARGAAAFVPQYAGGHMRFLRVLDGDQQQMATTKHGISQHSKEQSREDALEGGVLDLVIAPGVAFTRYGGRVGHSEGYYTRSALKGGWAKIYGLCTMNGQTRRMCGGLDLVIAPGVAFTRSGGRVGHGGGYYDKFLAKLRTNPDTAPKVIAVAFTCQIVDEVPMTEQDQKIDDVICADS